MTWSPDGAILAVAMSDGHLHLIEAEQGVVRWSRKLGRSTCAQQMRWFWSGDPPDPKSRLKWDWSYEDETKAAASIFGNGDVVDERLGKSLLYEILYLKSLRQTVLFMIRDDFVVLVLAGGILPLCEIRLMEKLAHLKLDVINIYDVMYTHRDGLTLAVTDYGPRPKLDEVDRDKFGSPSFMADAINCPHTHLINIDFKIENEDILWELLLRYLKVYHCLVHLTYSMELAKRDWESESKASVLIFANRLNSTPNDLRLGDALLNSLLGGAPGPLAERWLERTLGAAGIQSMREFVEKRFSGLVAVLRGQLSAAARSLAFQMDQYRDLIKELQDANTNYENVTLPSWNVTSRPSEFPSASSSAKIPDVTADHVFDAPDPTTSRLILDRLHSGGVRIQAKCEEMSQAATSNL
ncbi:putative bacteriochlorophyll 4-vinyl reductase [Cooperia oncophora]